MILDVLPARSPPNPEPKEFPYEALGELAGFSAFRPEAPRIARCVGRPEHTRPCSALVAPRYAAGHRQCTACFRGRVWPKKKRDVPLVDRWPV